MRPIFTRDCHVSTLTSHNVRGYNRRKARLSLRTCWALLSLRAYRALFTLRTYRTLFALRACRALFALRTYRTLFALRACRTLFALRTCLTRQTIDSITQNVRLIISISRCQY